MKNKYYYTLILILNFSMISAQYKNACFHTFEINSSYLNEARKIHFYFQKDTSKLKNGIFFFCTDGQMVLKENYIKIIDSLVNANIIYPINLILVESNENFIENNIQLRNLDYIKPQNDTLISSIKNLRFNNHMNFFLLEIPDFIQSKFDINVLKTNNYFFGVSNGAGFGVSLSSRNNSFIENYILFSEAGGDIDNFDHNERELKYYIAWGDKEPAPFRLSSLTKAQFFIENGYDVTLKEFSGGHNRIIWRNEFIDFLIKNFSIN
ncbi:MAG: hypothetical protein H6567_11995 [Lewinellaceae bacterium]|nr:hypothetical protein [Lewinellaceae bacterium]